MTQRTQHIIFFSALYAPHTGGVETYTQNLVEVLGGRGVRVSVVCMNTEHAPAYEEMDGVRIYRLPCRSFMGGRFQLPVKNASYRKTLQTLIDSINVDDDTSVVVNTRFYPHSLDGARFASEHHLPLLVIEHGSAHLTIGNPLIDQVIARYEHMMTKRLLAYQPHFAGVSSATTAWLNHFGIQSDDIIANAIDVDAFQRERSARDFRQELGIGEAFLVAFVGRFSPEKGIFSLIEAARLLEDSENRLDTDAPELPEHQVLEADVLSLRGVETSEKTSDAPAFSTEPAKPRIVLVCAGSGSLADVSDTVPKSVVSVGLLCRADVSALYAQADAFCLPSRSEGFCTALLEAASWGVTPVITQVGGVDEVTDNGQWGEILPDVAPTTIARALMHQERIQREHPDMAQKSAQALIEHVREQCSWNASAEALLELLERINQ